MQFAKYHALGNDYLVLPATECPQLLTPAQIERICHRNFGLGSDGILYGPLPGTEGAPFGLRIFNPDGSEAEKSGNGIRIFARWLYDTGQVNTAPFKLHTIGGVVECAVSEGGSSIRVEMGKVSFLSSLIPMAGTEREVVRETLSLEGKDYMFCAATVGNPHCVLPMDNISEEIARRLGPQIERHPWFPNRTNVQFLKVIDRKTIQIEIWERGAGYTLASGSSSSASAAVAHKLGLVDNDITVLMPGGKLRIEIGKDFSIVMTGPTTRVGTMLLDDAIWTY